MVNLSGSFRSLKPRKVLVVGDLIVDTYTIGKVKRISPEAPVPVLHVHSEEMRPGGAGNVILGLIAMGMDVVALGRVGHDSAGEKMKESLVEQGVDISGIIQEQQFQTPLKNRMIAGMQQVVRVDYEKITQLPEALEQHLIDKLDDFMAGVEIVAVSDYGKGFLTPTFLQALIEHAQKRGIPVVVDPKGSDFSKYKGATLIKPNFAEALEASSMDSTAPLPDIAKKILKDTDAEVLFLTRSEEGISIFEKGKKEAQNFPVQIREVIDVTGAGDTVLVMLACSLANGQSLATAARLSNVAAGIAIEHMGCFHVSLSLLARRLLEFDSSNKVFKQEQLFVLEHLLEDRTYSILALDNVDKLSPSVFHAIQNLAKRKGEDLIVYLRESEVEDDFLRMIASFKEVDFIVYDHESVKRLIQRFVPREVFQVEAGKLCTRETEELILN